MPTAHFRPAPPLYEHLQRREWAICLLVALMLAGVLTRQVEARLLPAVQPLLSAQLANSVTGFLSRQIAGELAEEVAYDDLTTLVRDEDGQITAMTTNVRQMNLLKEAVVGEVSHYLETLDAGQFAVPVGSLTRRAALSGRGLSIPLKGVTAGQVEASFHQQFTQAGINQTRHQILLTVTVPLHLLLARESWTETVETQILVAETVIVGQVPQTYLQLP